MLHELTNRTWLFPRSSSAEQNCVPSGFSPWGPVPACVDSGHRVWETPPLWELCAPAHCLKQHECKRLRLQEDKLGFYIIEGVITVNRTYLLGWSTDRFSHTRIWGQLLLRGACQIKKYRRPAALLTLSWGNVALVFKVHSVGVQSEAHPLLVMIHPFSPHHPTALTHTHKTQNEAIEAM